MLTFYAELLPNIRSISLLVSLDKPANASTRVIVDPGATSATLHSHGESICLALPAAANPGPQQLLIRLSLGEKKLSCRLPLASSSAPPRSSDIENYAPWSAPELSAKTSVSFRCRACGANLISADRIMKWKDLPSGNWADMMDFWHCHKPHDDRQTTGGDHERYSTFGKGFVVEQGVGLVDRGYLLFSQKDCDATQAVETKLKCASCDMLLGAVEDCVGSDDSPMWRVNKWNVRLHDGESEVAYPLECFLSSQFISYAEEGGVRRLLVTTEDDADSQVNGLKVWIFNPDIWYTHTQSTKSVRGVKVFWQTMKPGETVATDSLKPTGFEGVVLDTNAFQTLRQCLEQSNKVLPGDIGKSGEWSAGVLRRFEG